jgi:hypothetical protein
VDSDQRICLRVGPPLSPSSQAESLTQRIPSLTRFVDIHPGGSGVLLASGIAGGDSSDAFFSLHRSDVLVKYGRYKIGTLIDPTSKTYVLPTPGALSPVPYAEPGWLTPSFRSPYFNDSHRALQKEMRLFFDTEVKREAREHEVSHERPTQRIMELMGSPRWEIS